MTAWVQAAGDRSSSQAWVRYRPDAGDRTMLGCSGSRENSTNMTTCAYCTRLQDTFVQAQVTRKIKVQRISPGLSDMRVP